WSPYFFNFDNFDNILIATSVVAVLALGETFVIVAGGIDLSIGTVMTVSSVMSATAIVRWGLPVPVGMVVGIAMGGLMGLIKGVLIARLKLPPFSAPRGMLNVARGLSLAFVDLSPRNFPPRAPPAKLMCSSSGVI